jgi:acetyl-CoA synthetase
LDALLCEGRSFAPSQEFTAQANVNLTDIYEQASQDSEGYWAGMAAELDWFRQWDQTLKWEPPFASWFVGGRLNASYNCVDRHLRSYRRNKAAIIWEGEPGDQRTLTYQDLHREVCKFANVLKGLGVKKGDRVTLYMPLVPELVIAMLATARIGAVHSVIFGGFSVEAVRDRIVDAGSKIVVTADGGYRRGAVVRLKHNVDLALQDTNMVEKVVVVKRVGQDPGEDDKRDEINEMK